MNQPDPHFRRSIILLSDGKVDISKDAEKNEQSRQRIIQSVLPKLRSAGVVVHTIALSDNADHELLKTLAVSTDGWYENAKSADNLHRIFLRLFEKSAPSDTLPLRNNVFKVDSSIKDMTLLIFHQPNDKNVGVIDAKGKKYTEAAHPDNVQWHSEDQFDLVTITNPQAGQWSLDTKEDPDNRVMVVTNLKLGLNELPNNIMIGENLAVHAQLLQENKLLTEKTIMDRVGFSLQQQQGGDKEEKISLSASSDHYQRYLDTQTGISPLAFVPKKGQAIKINSYEHDQDGITTEDPVIAKTMQDKRLKKEKFLIEELQKHPMVQVYGNTQADKAVLCWGSSKGTCIEAAKKMNIKVIHIQVAKPFPYDQLKEAMKGVKRLVCMEYNSTGQMAGIVTSHGFTVDDKILKYDGRPFLIEDLEKEIEKVMV